VKLAGNLAGYLFHLFQSARRDRHVCPFMRKSERYRAANAAPAASD
jgi:hypothetical protein